MHSIFEEFAMPNTYYHDKKGYGSISNHSFADALQNKQAKSDYQNKFGDLRPARSIA